MYRRLRWLAVVAGVLLIAMVEVLSDIVPDQSVRSPVRAILVLGVVSGVAAVAASLDFRRIDRLTGDLMDRNAELESRNEALRAVYELSLAVSRQMDPDQTISAILDRARALLGMDAALAVVEGAAGEFRVAAASAEPGVLVGNEPGPPEARSSGAAELGGYLRPGYVVRISAPVVLGNRRVGTLGLASRTARPFTPTEVETVSALATQVGLTLEAARLADELQVLAVQDERERIAREMHDGLAQVLAYVNTKSQAVDELLAEGRTEDARRQLGELAAAARSLYVDVREAILSLSSPVTPDRSVALALEEYAAQWAESSKLVVRFAASPEAAGAPLSAAVGSEVFAIAREALTNVRKHARARRVSVSLARRGRKVVLRVEDDGVGFEAELLARDPERWPHFGLAGMRERAESVGGSIAWHGRPGAGTVVELHVPVEGPAAAGPPRASASSGGTVRPTAHHRAGRPSADASGEAD